MATTLYPYRATNPSGDFNTDYLNEAGTAIGWTPFVAKTTRDASATGFGGTPVSAGTPFEPIGGGADSSTKVCWVTEPVSADVTIAGTITFNVRAQELAMTDNIGVCCRIDVLRANARGTRNGNTLATIVNSAKGTELGTSEAAQNWTATPTSTVVNKGDRLRITFYFDDAGGTMAGTAQGTVYVAGPTAGASGDTYVTFTETFSFIDPTSTPAGSVIYLTDTASPINPGSAIEKEAWTSRGAGVTSGVTNQQAGFVAGYQCTDTGGGTVIEWYTRRLQAFTLGGYAKGNIRWKTSTTTAYGAPTVEIAVVDSDGSNPVTWSWWGAGPDLAGISTTEKAVLVPLSGDDLSVADGQRLRIRVFVDDSRGRTGVVGQTSTFYWAGTSGGASGDSYITFPQTLLEYVPPAPASPRHSAIQFQDPAVL